MALWEVIKPFKGKVEKRTFDKTGEEVEMTVKRREELEANIEKEKPGYGPVLQRKEEK